LPSNVPERCMFTSKTLL